MKKIVGQESTWATIFLTINIVAQNSHLGDDVLHYKYRRPRWRKSSAKVSIIKFRISWFWWSEKRNWKPTVRYDENNELHGWKKIQLHLTKIRARSVRSIGVVKPLNGRKRLFDPPNHVIWPDLQLRIVSNRRDAYGTVKKNKTKINTRDRATTR